MLSDDIAAIASALEANPSNTIVIQACAERLRAIGEALLEQEREVVPPHLRQPERRSA